MPLIDPDTVEGIYWKSVRDYLRNQFTSLFSSSDSLTTTTETHTTEIATLQSDVAGNSTFITRLFNLFGVSSAASDLGTFTGSTIADNSSAKTALQALETKAELNATNLANKIAADAISISTGTVSATGSVSGERNGAYAYLPSPANTTVTTANTYYPIQGTFTNEVAYNFGAATTYTPGIKYTGATTQFFEIDWHATVSANLPGTVIHVGVKKNNVLQTGSIMGIWAFNANEEYPGSGTLVLSLATNDEIQLVITSDGNGDVLTVGHFTTTINEFFD